MFACPLTSPVPRKVFATDARMRDVRWAVSSAPDCQADDASGAGDAAANDAANRAATAADAFVNLMNEPPFDLNAEFQN